MGFNFLHICTERLHYWFLNNGLMQNPDKSEALLVGTVQQRNAVATVQSVPVAGADHVRIKVIGCDHRQSTVL